MHKAIQSGVSIKKIRKDRLDICRSCEFAENSKELSIRCSVCGCYMQGKVLIVTANCPKNKWKL